MTDDEPVSTVPLSRPGGLLNWQRIIELAGIDRAIAWSAAPRVWTVLFAPITVTLIATRLTVNEQGYYFTFSSLAAIQVLFELGLASVIQQFVSHERAFLDLNADGVAAGSGVHKERLGSLVRQALRWYATAAVLLSIALVAGGSFFFAVARTEVRGWLGPWCVISIATSALLFVNFAFAVLEGCGLVSDVARVRSLQVLVVQVLIWSLLIANARLWAPAIAQIAGLAVVAAWLLRTHRRFFVDLMQTYGESMSWRREVWPLQWRTALSWASSYFVLQTFTPLLFLIAGPAAAARMGMTLSIMNVLSSLSMTWLLTKRPFFAMNVARRDFAKLDALFFPAMIRAFLVMLAGTAAFIAGTYALSAMHHPWRERLLPPAALLLLAGSFLTTQILWSESAYLRAHKQEVLLPARLTSAALTFLLAILLGLRWGETGMMAGFLAVSTVVSLGMGTWIFVRKRREWHGATNGGESGIRTHGTG